MKQLPVIYSPLASRQLAELRRYIENHSGPFRAATYVDSLIDYCDGFSTFPERGTRRDDIAIGLRTIGYRRRATIAFLVEPHQVVVIGVFYGGQDYEAALSEPDESPS
jgi:toxin ParE1/3/4